MDSTTRTPTLAQQLRYQLEELDFIYKRLPSLLERAGSGAAGERWSRFFREHSAALRTHHADLRAAVAFWGHVLGPCVCAEASELLNEIRHALVSRKGGSERSAHEALVQLRALLLIRLKGSENIALRLGEHELAQRLTTLVDYEKQRDARMEEPWRHG